LSASSRYSFFEGEEVGKASVYLLSAVLFGAVFVGIQSMPNGNRERTGSIAVAQTACKVAIGSTAWEGYPGFQRRREIPGPDNCREMTKGTRGSFAIVDEGQPCFFLDGKGECWFVPADAIDFDVQGQEVQ
jgi:hypothetical protein